MANYELTEDEQKKATKFKEKHYKKCNSGTSIIFTETGIGLVVKVQCDNCGKLKDISDYSSW